MNKLQLENQGLTRKVSDLENHYRYLEEQLGIVDKNHDRL